MKKMKSENGEVMLEGMIVMIITMLLLIWILGIGFVYYQRYLVTAVTNDAATKISATYNNPDSDIILGYIETESLSERDLYRNFNKSSLVSVNEKKADDYVKYALERINFAGTVKDVNVSLKMVQDSVFRKHIEIETICTFNTPFGIGLSIFGMQEQTTYKATGRADCTDIIDYISTAEFAKNGLDISESVIGMLETLLKIFNHTYS